MEINISKRIDWIKKRVELDSITEEYVEFQMKEAVTEALVMSSSNNGNSLYEQLKSHAQKFKGYTQRVSGASTIGKDLKCDCCGFPAVVLTGYENNYPENKDISICSNCAKVIDEINED